MAHDRFTAVVNLFVLNENLPYVITQKWEELGNTTTQLLVNDKKEFISKVGLKKDPTAKEVTRNLYRWRYGVKNHQFEVRDVADCFYHPFLGERLLKGRVKHEDMQIYILHPKDRFFEMLYTVRYRTGLISNEEMALLVKYQPEDFKGKFDDRDYVHAYLCNLGFFPIACKDSTVRLLK